MMEEMFLWSAICSAKTTNATGTYAAKIVPTYVPESSVKPPSAVTNVNEGTAKNVERPTPSAVRAVNESKLKSLIESLPVAFPISVSIRQNAYPASIP